VKRMSGPMIGVQMGINGYGMFGNMPVTDLDRVLAIAAGQSVDGIEVMSNLLAEPRSLRRQCADYGLEIAAVHLFLNELDDSVLRVIEELQAARIILSAVAPSARTTWDEVAVTVQDWSQKIAAAGARLLVHNHAEECRPADGYDTGLELLASRIDGSALGFVVDVFWATRAGIDIGNLLTRLINRCDYMHIKDGKTTADPEDTYSYGLCEGDVDLAGALRRQDQLMWVMIERDLPPDSSEVALRHDVDVLRRLLTTDNPG